MRIPHPIPYQGSKRRLAPIIGRYIPRSTKTFYEPFAGSAAMTIYAANRSCAEKFVIADSLEPIVRLLRLIVEQPDEKQLPAIARFGRKMKNTRMAILPRCAVAIIKARTQLTCFI